MFTHRKIKKVVIPIAGMGTRFLPVTKVIPKELLPIIDKPIIHLIVQEAIDAGIETVVFVTSRPKILVEDYFDPADLTAHKLVSQNKSDLIESTLELSKKIDFVSVRQYEQKGLGHAVLQASPVVNGQPFAVILGDDVILKSSRSTGIGPCIEKFESLGKGSVVGTVEVNRKEVSKYGVLKLKSGSSDQIEAFVEKPPTNEAPSNLIMPGRYVFEKEIIDTLETTKPTLNNEIQLTEAMSTLLKTQPFFATQILGTRYDTGDKLGYIMANVAMALQDNNLKGELRSWLVEQIEESSK